jgi:pyridoxamine 5'-phosphate oxidase-like protein
MDAKRGDLALLAHPVARQLLQAPFPARLAYVARDGAPRVVPMQFHWTGKEIVVACWPDDPKAAAIRAHPAVALTIDTNELPYAALQIRGLARIDVVDGPPPDMVAAARRAFGDEAGQAWVEQAGRLSPRFARIAIRPTWVDLLDFETRLPGGIARRLAAMAT